MNIKRNEQGLPVCITGKNPYGLCSCCHYDGTPCCAWCKEIDDCNICVWIFETGGYTMTDNEIIKALERCPQHTECCYCNSLEECGNKRILTTSVFDLINRQKAEILELQKRIINWRADMDYRPDEIKSEAIKEFADRLKTETFLAKAVESVEHVIWMNEIDNIVKEMTE